MRLSPPSLTELLLMSQCPRFKNSTFLLLVVFVIIQSAVMALALNCLPYASQYLASRKKKSAPQSSSITPAPNLKWQAVPGPVSSSLLSEMQRMYWDGVKRELGHMILTLRKWQTPEYAAAILPDEEDDFLHGFDTFVDQVSELSREFAERYGERVMGWKGGEQIGYEQALRDMGRDIEASEESESLKGEIRDILAGKSSSNFVLELVLIEIERKRYTVIQRRARMLLQSAGFLDIDKLIEYRPPEELVTFWKRPVAPQCMSLHRSEYPVLTISSNRRDL
jgi:hypothetical protein